MEPFKKVIILAPHTDDAEIGCGATIHKLIESKCEVHVFAFSSCDESLPPEFAPGTLINEMQLALQSLGVINFSTFNYPVRNFAAHRQSILDDLIKIRDMIMPDAIFIPALNDVHQDHFTVANEAVRAFKNTNIFCYEMPWNNLSFKTTAFMELSEINIQKKHAALCFYKSQQHRQAFKNDFIRSLAIVRGTQIGRQYAEVFEVIRTIL